MMNFPLELKALEKTELAEYGLAQVRDVAFDAFLRMWRYRQSQGWTQKRLADNIGRDKATVSKYLRGPANWTMRTLGELVQGLEADVQITIEPLEEPSQDGANYDAYDEHDWNTSRIKAVTPLPLPLATGTAVSSAIYSVVKNV